MKEIKLLIADTDMRFVRDVENVLSAYPSIKIVGHCDDGRTLLKMIRENRPDAVLTELVLRTMDAISVMKTLCGANDRPVFVVCTDFYNELCIRRTRKYGASAFLCKPVCPESLADAIIESCDMETGGISRLDPIDESDKSGCGADSITERLVSIGISQDSEGFRYLQDAVMLVRRHPEVISSMTKLLYPELARMNNTTPECAERNIRTAIQRAHAGSGFNINGRRPTNREMIAYLAGSASA